MNKKEIEKTFRLLDIETPEKRAKFTSGMDIGKTKEHGDRLDFIVTDTRTQEVTGEKHAKLVRDSTR